MWDLPQSVDFTCKETPFYFLTCGNICDIWEYIRPWISPDPSLQKLRVFFLILKAFPWTNCIHYDKFYVYFGSTCCKKKTKIYLLFYDLVLLI